MEFIIICCPNCNSPEIEEDVTHVFECSECYTIFDCCEAETRILTINE